MREPHKKRGPRVRRVAVRKTWVIDPVTKVRGGKKRELEAKLVGREIQETVAYMRLYEDTTASNDAAE